MHLSVFPQHSKTYISKPYMEYIKVYSRRMSSRAVYERQVIQNGHKAATNMVYTDKNWEKLYEKYTKFCYFNKTHLVVGKNKQAKITSKNCNILVI